MCDNENNKKKDEFMNDTIDSISGIVNMILGNHKMDKEETSDFEKRINDLLDVCEDYVEFIKALNDFGEVLASVKDEKEPEKEPETDSISNLKCAAAEDDQPKQSEKSTCMGCCHDCQCGKKKISFPKEENRDDDRDDDIDDGYEKLHAYYTKATDKAVRSIGMFIGREDVIQKAFDQAIINGTIGYDNDLDELIIPNILTYTYRESYITDRVFDYKVLKEKTPPRIYDVDQDMNKNLSLALTWGVFDYFHENRDEYLSALTYGGTDLLRKYAHEYLTSNWIDAFCASVNDVLFTDESGLYARVTGSLTQSNKVAKIYQSNSLGILPETNPEDDFIEIRFDLRIPVFQLSEVFYTMAKKRK